MRKLLLILLSVSFFACKSKPSLSGNDPVNYDEFKAAFTDLELPFTVSDTTINRLVDTATISRAIFRQFVPDTIFSHFGKDTTFKLHAIGKIERDTDEDYFAIHASTKKKAAVYLLAFRRDSFSAAMPLLMSNNGKEHFSATIDPKLSVMINKEWNDNGELMYNRTVYAYNNVGVFTTVVTETNVPPVLTAKTVLNPIDTFPRKNKYSGDYVKGPKNFISIRDGDKAGTYQFFVHFINDGDDPCGGDLRGEMVMTSETTGQYSSSGDPCVIDFTFSKNSIKVKEQGSCGNYRGITCFFDDTYTKKKEPKPTGKNAKTKN